MPAPVPTSTNSTTWRERRTGSRWPPSACTGTPARPRLRATGTAVASPPSRTAGLAAKPRLLRLAVDDYAAVLEDRVDPGIREVAGRDRVVVRGFGRGALLESPQQVIGELARDD